MLWLECWKTAVVGGDGGGGGGGGDKRTDHPGRRSHGQPPKRRANKRVGQRASEASQHASEQAKQAKQATIGALLITSAVLDLCLSVLSTGSHSHGPTTLSQRRGKPPTATAGSVNRFVRFNTVPPIHPRTSPPLSTDLLGHCFVFRPRSSVSIFYRLISLFTLESFRPKPVDLHFLSLGCTFVRANTLAGRLAHLSFLDSSFAGA